jgi:ABC-type dipeptide/oligopeptide/nickel transport system permease component
LTQQALEKYFKNTGMLFIGRVGSLFIKMLVGIAVANYLGREHNGHYYRVARYISTFFRQLPRWGSISLLLKNYTSFRITVTRYWAPPFG